MARFETITACIQSEMTEVRSLLDRTLRSRVPLADRVIDYFRDRKGKGVRPIMTVLAARLLAEHVSQSCYDGAVALELVHNASLMHDDVIDESDQRRGSSTINHVWDNKVAVLMGDFFLSKALLRLYHAQSLPMLAVLADMVTRLSEGELDQLSGARESNLDEQVYMRIIADKTAALFAACMKVGALSAGATEAEVVALGEVGELMGLIFQMRDDLFDYYPSAEMGKPSGHDIREGKVTLPLLYALRNETVPAERTRMVQLLDRHEALTDDEVAQLVAYAERGGGIAYTERRMEALAAEARQKLSAFPDGEPRQALVLMIDYFIERNR